MGPTTRVAVDFEGRSIRLTDERLAHISEHPEMASAEPRIVETLANPDAVVQSRSDEAVRLYYRHYSQTVVGPKWLCAVVKVTGDDAFVITAYLTDRLKRGTVLWQRDQ